MPFGEELLIAAETRLARRILARTVDDPALFDEILEATATELGRR